MKKVFKEMIDDGGIGHTINVVEEIMSNISKVKRIILSGMAMVNMFKVPKKYIKEMKEYALITGVSYTDLYISNCIYESTMLGFTLLEKNWCSSFSIRTQNTLKHFRSMDWPINSIKEATRIVTLEGKNEIKSIATPGQFNVITGYSKKGKFSVSMNMDVVSWSFYLITGKPVAFLIREGLEKFDNQKDFVDYLISSTTMAPAFVHVVGVDTNEIIHMNPKGNRIVDFSKKSLSITNHDYSYDPLYESDPECFEDTNHNLENECLIDSIERKAKLIDCCDITTMREGVKILTNDPILNELTQQSAVINPDSGKIDLYEI